MPDVISYDIEELKNHTECIDAVIISVPWNMIESMVEKVLPLNIPILAEKPVSLSCGKLLLWKDKYCVENLYVAYNREHYDFISKLKSDLDNQDIIAVDVLSADPLSLVKNQFGSKIVDNFCLYYTSHLIHLMITIIGDVTIEHMQYSEYAKQVHLKNKTGLPISLNIINDAHQNSYIKIFTSKRVFQIQPLEELTVYNKIMKITDNKINRYLPQIEEQYETSNDYKPGFKNQLIFFINKFVKEKNIDLDYYDKVIKVCSLCEGLG